MRKKPVRSYCEAFQLLKEGDVLLFTSTVWYSWFIKKFTKSPYSHSAIVSRHNGTIEILEFHGFTGGGVARSLARNVKENSGKIDVYRPAPARIDQLVTGNLDIVEKTVYFDGKAVTKAMRKISGLPYGWFRI